MMTPLVPKSTLSCRSAPVAKAELRDPLALEIPIMALRLFRPMPVVGLMLLIARTGVSSVRNCGPTRVFTNRCALLKVRAPLQQEHGVLNPISFTPQKGSCLSFCSKWPTLEYGIEYDEAAVAAALLVGVPMICSYKYARIPSNLS